MVARPAGAVSLVALGVALAVSTLAGLPIASKQPGRLSSTEA
jgi:hypothetical protein